MGKNFELGSSHAELSKGMMDCFRLMTTMISPLLSSKEWENRRLRKYINDKL